MASAIEVTSGVLAVAGSCLSGSANKGRPHDCFCVRGKGAGWAEIPRLSRQRRIAFTQSTAWTVCMRGCVPKNVRLSRGEAPATKLFQPELLLQLGILLATPVGEHFLQTLIFSFQRQQVLQSVAGRRGLFGGDGRRLAANLRGKIFSTALSGE